MANNHILLHMWLYYIGAILTAFYIGYLAKSKAWLEFEDKKLGLIVIAIFAAFIFFSWPVIAFLTVLVLVMDKWYKRC